MSSQQYYETSSRHGEYQYVKLTDIINNYMLLNVGDDQIVNDVKRFQVVHYAKKAIQELNFGALQETRKLEFELGENLQMTVPEDFVQLVNLSYIDKYGRMHPLTKNKVNVVADAYLQDETGDYTFDNDGNLQEATSLAAERMAEGEPRQSKDYIADEDEHTGGRYGMDTASANRNGTYLLDRKSGTIKFSSHLEEGTIIILQYITDGLFQLDDDEINVNKLAEDFVYHYIQHEILDRKFGVQEYVVRRAKKNASARLRNAKIRLMNIDFNDLVQNLKGKSKWIK